MAFEKLVIQPEGGAEITAQFNPTELSIDQSNKFAETGAVGMRAPILQFLQGNARTLSMALFFDAYEAGMDVQYFTDQIYGLLKPVAPTDTSPAPRGGAQDARGGPPICTLKWGSQSFKGVLETVSGKFTLFLENGTPVRATLNVTFREFVDLTVTEQDQKAVRAKMIRTYVVKPGDTLSAISRVQLGDEKKWRVIAAANGVSDPKKLQIGVTLIIPDVK